MRKRFYRHSLLAIGLFFLLIPLLASTTGEPEPGVQSDQLEQQFQNPPNSARPRVWWHWMNGNISAEGIKADLAWMSRVGIGGVQNFDVAWDTPQIVDERQVYMSAPWQQSFKQAVQTATDYKMTFGIAASPGFSETGGPWVAPQDAMKKLVWSETRVTAGKTLEVVLPKPPITTGPFQNLPLAADHMLGTKGHGHRYYQDVAVLAYPLSVEAIASSQALVRLNGLKVDSKVLMDNDWQTGIDFPALPASPDSPHALTIHYEEPVTVSSLQLYLHKPPGSYQTGPLQPQLQVRSPKGEWQTITSFSLSKVPTTASFAPVIGSEFRVIFSYGSRRSSTSFSPAPGVDIRALFDGVGGKGGDDTASTPKLMALKLGTQPRVHAFEKKAGFALVNDFYQLRLPAVAESPGIDPQSVVDITHHMQVDGRLDWQPSAGSWKVLRLGYSLTGKTNHPAPPEATGLEVDKYDAQAVERYLRTYLDSYQSITGAERMGKALQELVTDSTEVGPSNWTPRLIEQFKTLRGYDPTPWLPTLTGDLVGSRSQSDAFLYDFRRTLGELTATEHYGTIARIAHDYGLTVYGEALEGLRGKATLGDDIEMRRFADVPMAALWTHSLNAGPEPHLLADIRGAASAAHLYGKTFVAAESLTSVLNPWAHSPADLQPMIDQAFLHGVNRPVIHSVVHQPVEDKQPGLSLHIYGQFFGRHETWAEMATPWISYISRNSYMLQQGRNIADVAYFYGEETPLSVLAAGEYFSDVPSRYAYDFVPPDAVLNLLQVAEGDLVAEGGARYQLLYLGGTSHYMTLPVLQRLAALVDAGATLVGHAPQLSPSLADDHQAFAELVASLWSGTDVTRFGKGRVIRSRDIEAALALIDTLPDFEAIDAQAPVQFVHRQMGDMDIYFVANQGAAQQVTGRFRVTGKTPSIWHADTGQQTPVSYRIKGSITEVLLPMAERESFFVVFAEPAVEAERLIPLSEWKTLQSLKGPWDIGFKSSVGAPPDISLDSLSSLSEHPDPAVKYFSGIAQYRQSFTIDSIPASGTLMLDLGRVADVAEVLINGQPAGVAWKPPYQLNIGPLVQQGNNELEVRVANLWVNRLIGDQQPGVKPVTYTTIKHYLPDAPLRPSGLLGPVRLGVLK